MSRIRGSLIFNNPASKYWFIEFILSWCFVRQEQWSPCKSEDVPLEIISFNCIIKALYVDIIRNHEQISAYARDVFIWQKMKQLKLKAESVQKFKTERLDPGSVWFLDSWSWHFKLLERFASCLSYVVYLVTYHLNKGPSRRETFVDIGGGKHLRKESFDRRASAPSYLFSDWKMTYIGADGTVIQKRTLFRLSLISDVFFGVMDAILLFGYTLWYPNRSVPKAKRRATRDGGGEYQNKDMIEITKWEFTISTILP